MIYITWPWKNGRKGRVDGEVDRMGHGGIPVLLRVSGHPSWETSHYLHLIRGWQGTAARVRYRCKGRRGGDPGNRRIGEASRREAGMIKRAEAGSG